MIWKCKPDKLPSHFTLVMAFCQCSIILAKNEGKSCTYLWLSLFLMVALFPQAEFVWHKLSADNMDPDFVERRRIGLENFLLRVASHPVLCRDKIFYLFLTQVFFF